MNGLNKKLYNPFVILIHEKKKNSFIIYLVPLFIRIRRSIWQFLVLFSIWIPKGIVANIPIEFLKVVQRVTRASESKPFKIIFLERKDPILVPTTVMNCLIWFCVIVPQDVWVFFINSERINVSFRCLSFLDNMRIVSYINQS